jgi:dolichol-phosphate mannosyltransferase
LGARKFQQVGEMMNEKEPFLTVIILSKDEPEVDCAICGIEKVFGMDVDCRVDSTPGPGFAIAKNLSETKGKYLVVMMGDSSDDPRTIPLMVDAAEKRGLDIVCASRNMKGGKRIGAPFFRGWLSRISSLTLHWFTALNTSDATNAFKLYRLSKFQRPFTSKGFEISLELLYYSLNQGLCVDDVPTIWRERRLGSSKFKLREWFGGYLKWYLKILLWNF